MKLYLAEYIRPTTFVKLINLVDCNVKSSMEQYLRHFVACALNKPNPTNYSFIVNIAYHMITFLNYR